MTIKEWLNEHRDEYKNDRSGGIKKCAEELGIALKSVQNKVPNIWPAGEFKNVNGRTNRLKTENQPKIKTSNYAHDVKKDIIDADNFINSVDIVKQIMNFLNDEVKDGYIDDEKLRRRFEISTGKWREVQRLPIFEGRIFTYNRPNGSKATVWSSKKGISLAKNTISMARYEV